MPRFLVPIDFSPISVNAALYAVQMAEKMPRKEVILYNVIEEIHAGSDGTPIDFNGDVLMASNLAALENLQVSLFEMGMSPMEIVAEFGDLHQKLKPAVSKYNVDMVVMGIKGNASFDDIALGRNAIELSRNNNCPVMIVPPEAMFKGSGKVAIAVEYTNADSTISLKPIKKWLDVLMPELHIVYVAHPGNGTLTEAQQAEKKKLKAMFSDYPLVFSDVEAKSFSDGINDYIDQNNIDHVILFPKKNALFANVFSNTTTRKLAYHSHVPIISVHE